MPSLGAQRAKNLCLCLLILKRSVQPWTPANLLFPYCTSPSTEMKTSIGIGQTAHPTPPSFNSLHRLIFRQLRPLKSPLLSRRYALQSLPRHWFALAHSTGDTASLARTFGVSELPTLVVVRRKDGAIVAGAQMARKQAVAGPAEVKKWMHLAQRPLPCPPDVLLAAQQVDSKAEATAG